MFFLQGYVSVLVAIVASCHGSSSSSSLHHRTTNADIDPSSSDSHRNYVPPTGVVIVSPECWKLATAVLQTTYRQQNNNKEHHRHNTNDATRLCQALPEAHQKRLALEIARCHLQDLGRPLYRSSTAERECTTANMDHEAIHSCLKQLTDSGENAYTQYVSYVQILCIQLTQEVLLEYQQSVQDEVASKYAELAGQSIQNMEVIYQMSKSHADQMQSISEIPAILQDQLTRELKEQLKETLDEQLRDRVAELLQYQASEQATFWGNLMDHLELRNEEHQERVNDWTSYQTMIWQNQAREMDRQRATLDEQRMRMEHLSRTVAETTEIFQPLVGLQSLLRVATNGYTWMAFLLHFLGTFNVVWLITRPERCHVFRSYLYGVVVGEAVLEFALTAAVQYGVLTETGRVSLITELRRWALFVECIAYLVGLLGSCCIGVSKASETKGPLAIHTDVRVPVSAHDKEYVYHHQQQQVAACMQAKHQQQYGSAVNRKNSEHIDSTSAIFDHINPPYEAGAARFRDCGPCYDALGRSTDQASNRRNFSPGKSHINSGLSQTLSVIHHRPPVVIKMKHYHPTTPQNRSVQEAISTDPHHCAQPHQPKPTMLYPRRFSTKSDTIGRSSVIPAREGRASLSVLPEIDHGREAMEVTYNNDVENCHVGRSTKIKRPAITSPDMEPVPKKAAHVY